MKRLLSYMLTLLLFTCISCEVDVEIGDEDDGFDISTQVAQGKVEDGQPFTTVTALVQEKNMFNKDGYFFQLFDQVEPCSVQPIPDVSFFITSVELGNHDGDGPFFGGTSFFGSKVIITEVTTTTISGRVKGGDPDGDKYIEGSFTATICD